MQGSSLGSWLEFAVDTAWQAGRLTLGYFQRGVQVERKADATPVTVADRQAEQLIRERIGRYWPHHGIVGEELGQSEADSGLTWIVDPIDGTKSFVAGVPFYATLIALVDEIERRPLVGVACFPALGEVIYASQGGGCFWNGRAASVSAVSRLEEALLLTSELNTFARYGRERVWHELISVTYAQRTWGDAYGYALVATGRAEVMLDPAMAIWDSAPLQVIVEEAGGRFFDWQGRATIYSGNAVAVNQLLYEPVMAVIRQSG